MRKITRVWASRVEKFMPRNLKTIFADKLLRFPVPHVRHIGNETRRN